MFDPIPVPNRASLCPFVLNPTFEPKPTQSDTEPAEYSSSFFDDYEEDYEGGSEANSDDDFDEATLWEIATLLDSQDVPSRNSLFPCPRIIEDYDDEDDSEPDVTESTSNPNQPTVTSEWPATVKFIPIQPLKPLPLLPTPPQSDNCEQTDAVPERSFKQAAAPVWQAYLPALDDAIRGKPCEVVSEESWPQPKVDARMLWDKAIGAVSSLPVEKAVALWTQQSSFTTKMSSPISGHETSEERSQATLWTARDQQMLPQVSGLFAASVQRKNYDTQIPAEFVMSRKARADTTPLQTLSSQELWSVSKKSSSECHWISLSSVRAPSPSLCSTSSSGRSSPSSDEASISSAITNSSSLAGLDANGAVELTQVPAWREVSASSSLVSQAADKGQTADADPVGFSSKRPDSLRISRVLASRDLWESRAPVVESNPTRKTWRSSKIIVPDAFQETKWKARIEAPLTEQDATSTDTTKAVIEYDTAVRHPAFFASSMITSAAFVHPAATGYVVLPAIGSGRVDETSQLWASTSSITNQAPSSPSLWTKPMLAKDSSAPTAPLAKDSTARMRTKDLPPLILPTLSSTSFWRPPTPIKPSSQHWLHATALRTVLASPKTTEQSPLSMFLASTLLERSPEPSRSDTVPEASVLPKPGRSSTWMTPRRSNTVSGSQFKGLWVPATKQEHAQETSSTIPEYPVKRPSSYKHSSRQLGLDKVESTELWRPKRGLPESPKEWLRSRRATKVDFRY